MSQARVSQINVRLPQTLKVAGDEGLQELGLSPTAVVRALWKKLSYRGEDLDAVRSFLFDEEGSLDNAETTFEQSEVARGWHMVDASVRRLGLAAQQESLMWSPASDNDLVAQAFEERMQSRGLI